MIKKIFAILLIFSFAVLSAGVLYPVKNRKANAVIVIPPDADRVEKFAAKELQEHIREQIFLKFSFALLYFSLLLLNFFF